MNHLFVGALIPFIVAAAVYVRRRFRASAAMLLVVPASMFLGATWAVLPDLPRTFGLAGFDHEIAMNPVIDVFFWHYTINQHESASPWFNLGFVALLSGVFFAAWRELKLTEENR